MKTVFEKLMEARDRNLAKAQNTRDLNLVIFYKNVAACYENQALNMTVNEATAIYVGKSNC